MPTPNAGLATSASSSSSGGDPVPTTNIPLPPLPAIQRRDGTVYVSHDVLIARLSTLARHPDMAKATGAEALQSLINWLLTPVTPKTES